MSISQNVFASYKIKCRVCSRQTERSPSHTSAVAIAKIHKLRFQLLDHQPYSPDLASSDFFLSPHHKTALLGQRFSLNEETITFVNNYFAGKNSEYYLDGLQRRELHWEKYKEPMCIIKSIFKKFLLSLLGRKLFRPTMYIYYIY